MTSQAPYLTLDFENLNFDFNNPKLEFQNPKFDFEKPTFDFEGRLVDFQSQKKIALVSCNREGLGKVENSITPGALLGHSWGTGGSQIRLRLRRSVSWFSESKKKFALVSCKEERLGKVGFFITLEDCPGWAKWPR